MFLKKYDPDYGRRALLEKTLKGAAGAGVLAPLWPLISQAGTEAAGKAYPDELRSIEQYTKGAISPGDTVTADNVEHVKDLLDPIAYDQVKRLGRRIHISEPTQDVSKFFPYDYLDATLRNQGKAVFDEVGNVRTQDGKAWIGGSPFPDPKNAKEAIANLTLSWGRHDWSLSAIRDHDIGPDGEIAYQYDFYWAEQQVSSRVDGTYFRGRDDILRYNTTFFTRPDDTSGTAFLNTWSYDQRQFPDLIGYLPAFRRVRQYPTNQRFEPLVPGMQVYLSDAWAAGDPMLTWGNYKIVERKPMLGAIGPDNFMGGQPNWERPVHGGPKNQTFHDVWMEMIPECIVMECEPVGYARSPYSKRRIWVDVRNQLFVASVTFDRKGDMWKSFEPQFAQFSNQHETFLHGKDPAWSWTSVQIFDIQADRSTRYYVGKEVEGGYKTSFEADPDEVYNQYMTQQAIQRLGS
ncbi:hypothetical protein PC39_15779 [Salinisphaera sp. PC39]|uniref:DUF1329 domain-containing protein n=1 Tax=Salinisphaera sp. PC39 TaxID=1304156 RepID=UPI00334179EE